MGYEERKSQSTILQVSLPAFKISAASPCHPSPQANVVSSAVAKPPPNRAYCAIVLRRSLCIPLPAPIRTRRRKRPRTRTFTTPTDRHRILVHILPLMHPSTIPRCRAHCQHASCTPTIFRPSHVYIPSREEINGGISFMLCTVIRGWRTTA